VALRYIAPELLFNPNLKPNTASDVYAFAIVMYEIAHRYGICKIMLGFRW
jgi:serine/threonine protein kinase